MAYVSRGIAAIVFVCIILCAQFIFKRHDIHENSRRGYYEINNGMKKKDVLAILGAADARNDVQNGICGAKIETWTYKNGYQINIRFVDDIVVDKNEVRPETISEVVLHQIFSGEKKHNITDLSVGYSGGR